MWWVKRENQVGKEEEFGNISLRRKGWSWAIRDGQKKGEEKYKHVEQSQRWVRQQDMFQKDGKCGLE